MAIRSRQPLQGPRGSLQKLRYALAYLVMAVAVSGFVLLMLYQHFYEQIRQQNAELALRTVHIQRQTVERTLMEMREITVQLNADSEFSYNRLSSPGYDTYAARRILNRYVVANTLYYEIAILPSPQNAAHGVLSSRGSYRTDVFLAWYAGYGLEERLAQPDSALRDGPAVFTREGKGDYLLFVFPMPGYKPDRSRQLLFAMTKAKFDEHLHASLQEAGDNLTIYDARTGALVYQYRRTDAPEAWDWGRMDGQPEAAYQAGDRGYAAVASGFLPWCYVYEQDGTRLLGQVQRLKNHVGVVIGVTVVLTLALAYGMGWFTYRPLGRLLSLLGMDRRGTDKSFRRLTERVEEIMRRNLRLAEQLTDYAEITRDYMVQLLLCGQRQTLSHASIDEMGCIDLPHLYFTVLYFPVSIQDMDSRTHVQTRTDMLACIREAAGASGVAYGIEWANAALVLLINHTQPTLEAAFVDGLPPVFAQRYRRRLVAGIGLSVDSVEKLPDSMLHAVAASEYARFKGLAVYDGRARIPGPQSAEASPLDVAALLNALKACDAGCAFSYIDGMINAWRHSSASIETIHLQSFRLVMALVQLVQSMGLDACHEASLRLFEYTTLEEYEQRLRSLCQDICQAVARAASDEGRQALRQILDYVHRSYNDPDLSLTSMGAALNKSPSYLAKCFQEHLDTSPGRYIEMLRMDRARDLLVRTDLRIKDIVEQIGYRDVSSFVRKFRGKEGVTPNQYRTLHRAAG